MSASAEARIDLQGDAGCRLRGFLDLLAIEFHTEPDGGGEQQPDDEHDQDVKAPSPLPGFFRRYCLWHDYYSKDFHAAPPRQRNNAWRSDKVPRKPSGVLKPGESA